MKEYEVQMCRLDFITHLEYWHDVHNEYGVEVMLMDGYPLDYSLRIVLNNSPELETLKHAVVLAKNIPVNTAKEFANYFYRENKVFRMVPGKSTPFIAIQVMEIFNRWLVKYCTEET